MMFNLYQIRKSLVIAGVLLLVYCEANAQLSFDIEGNYIFSIPYNTVRIPSQGGTEFDIANDLKTENTFTYRIRISYTINEKHVISALVAPLTINSEGELTEDVFYSGETFRAGEFVTAKYKFNSYRLTYRYLFIRTAKLKLGAGLTGKIREANITLTGENSAADYPNLGFVPLINFYLHWTPSESWGILLEGDALASKQGRAEDIFLGATFKLSPGATLKGGYRILEGGADVTDNYNFTFVNYAALGIIIDIK